MHQKNLNKPVLFVDFNGVISYNDFWESIKSKSHPLHCYHSSIENYLFKQEPKIIQKWMLGDYSSEEIHKILEQKVGVSYDLLWQVFVKDCSNIDISNNVLHKLNQLKKQFYLILSTGNMDSFDRFTLPNNPILSQTFDEIDNSYNLKMFKSSNKGEYFKNKLDQLGRSMHEAFVIDDSEKICRVFSKLGGKAFCVYGEDKVLAVLVKLTNYGK